MPIVPYVPADMTEPVDVVDAIRARRGGRLLHIDRMLLHSPPLAEGWNGYLRAVRTRLALSPKLRELAICAVAILNGAHYEYAQHAPEFLQAGGTQEELDALRGGLTEEPDIPAFGAAEHAVISLTAQMTNNVEVSSATMDALRAALPDDRQVVEIVAVVATYNMVSRFLVALGIEPEPRHPPT